MSDRDWGDRAGFFATFILALLIGGILFQSGFVIAGFAVPVIAALVLLGGGDDDAE